jgi:hypothetical protein
MASSKTPASAAAQKVAAEVPYDPAAFSQKYGIPPSEAKTIIKRYGPSRKKLDSYMAAREA